MISRSNPLEKRRLSALFSPSPKGGWDLIGDCLEKDARVPCEKWGAASQHSLCSNELSGINELLYRLNRAIFGKGPYG